MLWLESQSFQLHEVQGEKTQNILSRELKLKFSALKESSLEVQHSGKKLKAELKLQKVRDNAAFSAHHLLPLIHHPRFQMSVPHAIF